jgi:hypothetical protein
VSKRTLSALAGLARPMSADMAALTRETLDGASRGVV